MTKPILKWIGGKTKILNQLFELFPTKIHHYHEIFLGGGSVLLEVLDSLEEKQMDVDQIYAYDLNKTLIHVYKNIKHIPDKVYNETKNIANIYSGITILKGDNKPTSYDEAILSKESFYYWCRHQYNILSDSEKCLPYGSALFIFLNKTCFKGLYRVGPNGFNVSFGNYKNPTIIDRSHLDSIHSLFVKYDVLFFHKDFIDSLNSIDNNENDFIYLDPPYSPVNSKSFTKYNEKKFCKNTHLKLFSICKNLKTSFVMSNSNTRLVNDSFKDYDIRLVECDRRINSKNPGSKAMEVLIVS